MAGPCGANVTEVYCGNVRRAHPRLDKTQHPEDRDCR